MFNIYIEYKEKFSFDRAVFTKPIKYLRDIKELEKIDEWIYWLHDDGKQGSTYCGNITKFIVNNQ